MRLLVFLLLIIVVYLALKRYVSSLFGVKRRPNPRGQSHRPPPITDELVKDPVCGTYVPKREAIVYGRGGKLYYFCSKKCLEEFKKSSKS